LAKLLADGFLWDLCYCIKTIFKVYVTDLAKVEVVTTTTEIVWFIWTSKGIRTVLPTVIKFITGTKQEARGWGEK